MDTFSARLGIAFQEYPGPGQLFNRKVYCLKLVEWFSGLKTVAKGLKQQHVAKSVYTRLNTLARRSVDNRFLRSQKLTVGNPLHLMDDLPIQRVETVN